MISSPVVFVIEKSFIGSDDWSVKSVTTSRSEARSEVRQLRAYFASKHMRLRVREEVAA